jgi:putative membrane protein
MLKLSLKLLGNIVAFYCAAQLFPSIHLETPETAIWAGLILWLVNLFIRPLLFLITLPVNFLTFGLFTLIVNTWMVLLTDTWLRGLKIPSFWVALAIAIIVSVLNMMLQSFRSNDSRKGVPVRG